MGLHTPADHTIRATNLSITGMNSVDLLPAVTIELDKMVKQTKAAGHIIVSHTVAFIPDLETILITLHTVKP